MTTPIKIKRSGTASSTPASLDHGELAINYADAKLFWKDATNTIRSFVFQAYASATHKSQHATGGSDALTPADIGAAPAASPAITGNATFEASSGVPVTITNTGTGNSLVVNDAAGDTTPFVVDASGNVGIWNSTPLAAIDASFASDSIPGSGFCGMRLHRSGSATTAFGCGIMLTALDDKGGIIAADGAQNIRFFNYTGSSIAERVRIDSSGNLLVGTTTAASRLTVNGVITVSATSGSAGSYLPSLTISGDANTGFGQVSGQSDTASIFTAGSERVRVDANGNVGIGASFGTTTRLLVAGSLSGTGTNYVVLASPTAQSAVTNLYGFLSSPAVASDCSLASLFHFSAQQGTYSGTVSGQIGFWAHSGLTGATNNYGFRSDIASGTGRWNFYGLGTAHNYFAGNVGIGSGRTSPASALDVNGVITVAAGTAAAPALVASGDPNTGAFFPAADTFAISTAGSERVRVDSSGRVGIGTNPSYVLHVNGAIATTTGDVYVLGGGVRVTRSSNPFILFTEGASGVGQLRASSSQLRMTDSTGASVFFALDTGSGNVGIGSGNTTPTAALDINSDKIRLRTAKTPASASDTGNAGDICWDASYLYICTATNTWRRIAHSTW